MNQFQESNNYAAGSDIKEKQHEKISVLITFKPIAVSAWLSSAKSPEEFFSRDISSFSSACCLSVGFMEGRACTSSGEYRSDNK